MTLDQAIARYTNNAEYERRNGSLQGCLEFRQLAEWIKDYKRLLEQEPCDDVVSRQWLMKCVNEGWIKFDTEKDKNIFIHLIRDIAPPVTPVTSQQKHEDEDIAKAFQLGLAFGFGEKHNEMDKIIEEVKKAVEENK